MTHALDDDDDDDSITAQLDLVDQLSADRTMLSCERTMLSYVRTALALVVSGASAIKLFPDSRTAIGSGWAFIAAGAATLLFGAWRFWVIRSHVRQRAKNAAS